VRRITIAVMGTISALVALFSYHTSTNSSSASANASAASGTGSSGGTTSTTPDSSSGSSSDSSSSGSSSGSSGSSSGSSSGTFTGDAVDTRWGVVQVQITVKNGKITKSEAIRYPNGNGRDQEINAYALPQLSSEVLQNQSAGIDAISGATVTSDGYTQSLQSAIDHANL
jgi:uncharacterized protein with FMN-binding domain